MRQIPLDTDVRIVIIQITAHFLCKRHRFFHVFCLRHICKNGAVLQKPVVEIGFLRIEFQL